MTRIEIERAFHEARKSDEDLLFVAETIAASGLLSSFSPQDIQTLCEHLLYHLRNTMHYITPVTSFGRVLTNKYPELARIEFDSKWQHLDSWHARFDTLVRAYRRWHDVKNKQT